MYEPIDNTEIIKLYEHNYTYDASELFDSSLAKVVSQQEIVSKLEEAKYVIKKSRRYNCLTLLFFLIVGVACIAFSKLFEPLIKCKTTTSCKAYKQNKCTENGKLFGCILSCCERNKVTKCTSNFTWYYKYSKMVQSSETFAANSSTYMTESYCDCYRPNYVTGPYDYNKFCHGKLKITGNIEKLGNSAVNQSLIMIGISNLFLIFCASVCFHLRGVNLGNVFRSWEEEKGISVVYTTFGGNHGTGLLAPLILLVCPLCHNGAYLKFHVPKVHPNH